MLLQHENIYILPALHYNMEMAAFARIAFLSLKPDCVAVELAETMQKTFLHAAERLPDISIALTVDRLQSSLFYLSEPCDAAFEGLRSALEGGVVGRCIDLDVDYYPEVRENLPDPYAAVRIGHRAYYETYCKASWDGRKAAKSQVDIAREWHMAKRLKELSLQHERVLCICGMSHAENVRQLLAERHFPTYEHAAREQVRLCTLTDESARQVMAECGYVTMAYERARMDATVLPLDRQQLLLRLYRESSKPYMENHGVDYFPGYHYRNLMKYVRNYALVTGRLTPDLYQILSVAKGCVDHNYAYEVWKLATDYPLRRNIDNLPELDIPVEQIWGHAKRIQFHLVDRGRKKGFLNRLKKDRANWRFDPPSPFSICSYQPEDTVVENFGTFLRKKGVQLLSEEGASTVPFSSSLEDGIDTRETIRHWSDRKLYVKVHGKPPGGVGSVVVIFDEDGDKGRRQEKFPWCLTWLGEHQQESDMAFYATPPAVKVVGPGISECEYGGFMMTYPPRRVYDVWHDPDYHECRTKAELLLVAAIDYAVQPIVVYVAEKSPRTAIKSFARRYGKKVVYIPLGQLSPVTLSRIRRFHVLDGYDKRLIADEYID